MFCLLGGAYSRGYKRMSCVGIMVMYNASLVDIIWKNKMTSKLEMGCMLMGEKTLVRNNEILCGLFIGGRWKKPSPTNEQTKIQELSFYWDL